MGAKQHGMHNAEMNRRNNHIHQMNDMFHNGTFINPFSFPGLPSGPINFANEVVATDEIKTSMTKALDKGTSMAERFVTERLVPRENQSSSVKSFYAPLQRANIKTMVQMNKKVRMRSKDVSISGEDMYLRLLAINASKRVPLERLISYEDTAVPLSIFSDDGGILSGTKSVFMQKLESILPNEPITSITNADAVIVDANATLYELQVPATLNSTYDQMAGKFTNHTLGVCTALCGSSIATLKHAFLRLNGSNDISNIFTCV